jgi:SAM-dependent methyltransferase
VTVTTSDLRVWEAAEIERSRVEAAQTAVDAFVYTEENLRRYLNPPPDTPYPLEYAFHALGDLSGKVVLDYGCGNGENTVPLAARGARVIGLDLSHALLDLAQTRMNMNGFPESARFIAASAHSVPLPDGSIDAILGVAVLHHLDLDIAANEVHRLLKPGGRAVFQEPVRNSRVIKTLREMIPYRQEDVSPYERPLTDEELRRFGSRFATCRMRAFSLPFINLANVVPPLRAHVLGLYKMDGLVLRHAPALKPYAGIRVVEVVK